MLSTLPKTFTYQNVQIPTIGLGTSSISTDISEVVYSSIKNGVRLIDTAASYGSEEGIGKGIKKAINEGIIKREDLFIVTKLSNKVKWSPEDSIKTSLKNLGVDYIDLFLDHWPEYYKYNEKGEKVNKLPLHELWPIMESFVEKGYTKYLGVSNYTVQTLLNLLSFCKIKPLVNEVEFHPYLYQKKLNEFCKSENILLFGYNPLVKGWYCEKTGNEKDRNLLSDEVIVNLSKKYNKTPGQIVLNWFVSRDVVPLPMTSKTDRVIENLGATEFVMEKEDLEKIDGLNKNMRFGRSELFGIYDYKIDVFA